MPYFSALWLLVFPLWPLCPSPLSSASYFGINTISTPPARHASITDTRLSDNPHAFH